MSSVKEMNWFRLDICAFYNNLKSQNFMTDLKLNHKNCHMVQYGIIRFYITIVKIQCDIRHTLLNLIKKGHNLLLSLNSISAPTTLFGGVFFFSSRHIFEDAPLATNQLPPSQPATQYQKMSCLRLCYITVMEGLMKFLPRTLIKRVSPELCTPCLEAAFTRPDRFFV